MQPRIMVSRGYTFSRLDLVAGRPGPTILCAVVARWRPQDLQTSDSFGPTSELNDGSLALLGGSQIATSVLIPREERGT